jgi:predicted metalloprotease with PDZ domain
MSRRVLIAASLALGVATATRAAEPPLMTVRITPSAMDGQAGRGAVEIAETLPGVDVAPNAPLLALGSGAPGMNGAQPVEWLDVHDTEGPITLTLKDDEGDSLWRAARRVHGDLVVRYRLPIDNVRGSSPPVALHVDGASFSGPGRMLVAQPQVPGAWRVALQWDLSAMGPGAVGVSSFGDGDAMMPPGRLERLAEVIFMAGWLQRDPPDGHGAFAAVWGGEPPFDPRPAMQWTAQLHAWMSRFFGDTTEPPYRVFLRSNPQNPGGGVAMIHSFAVGWGPATTGESLKSILGHEMTHTWTAGGDVAGKWFNEGDAVYYQALLPWRAGLISTDDYLANLNRTASRYYTDIMLHTPEAEVLPHFWEDTRIRVLSYDRGAMYFAVLNGMVRRKSHGQRSIDDLIKMMVERNRRDEPITEAVWLDLLQHELGPAGPAVHRKMMAGGLMLPRSDDFGPCFRRVVTPIRRFDLGFDHAATWGRDKTIRGLKPGSEAEKAGVRDGDTLVYAEASDVVQADVNRQATVRVLRDGKPLTFKYLPRGEAVGAWQWQRVPGVPEQACKTASPH